MPLFKKTDQRPGLWRLREENGNPAWWVDRHGKQHAYADGDLRAFPIYEAEDFDDFVLTCYLKKTLAAGWIDRQGRFWGNDFFDHNNTIHDMLKKTVAEVEAGGWVKLNFHEWICLRPLSPEQRATLIRIGREPEDPHYQDEGVTFDQAFPRGYNLALLPKCKGVRVYPEGQDAGPKPRGPAPGF
jgi:hypothetical protein